MMGQIIHAIRLATHIFVGIFLLVATGALWNNKSALVKRTKQWWLGKITTILSIDLEVRGTIPAPQNGRGVLLVSNHVSWIDIPLIGGLMQLNFLSKAEVRSWPLIGKLAEGTGTLFINRGAGDGNLIAKNIADYLDDGRSVLFFPEGTTSDGRQVRRFHSKLLQAARYTSSVTLYPVAIEYRVEGLSHNPVAFIDDDDFTAHLWNLLRFRRIKARVNFLPPRQVPKENLGQFASQVRDEIIATLHMNTDITCTNDQSPDASNHAVARGEAASF